MRQRVCPARLFAVPVSTDLDEMAGVLLAAAGILAAVLVAPHVFPQHKGPRVMAVEFDGDWAYAALDNEDRIGPLVRMQIPERANYTRSGPGDAGPCWEYETHKSVKGWRQKLSRQQAAEFERIYCDAVGSSNNMHLVDCSWTFDGKRDCTGKDWPDLYDDSPWAGGRQDDCEASWTLDDKGDCTEEEHRERLRQVQMLVDVFGGR